MASSKKSKTEKIEEEEEEKRKKKKRKEQDWDGRIAELTKPGKHVGEKKSKSNSTRKANEPRSRKSNAKNSGNKKRSSQNGAVKEPEVFVIGSSSSDLEEHDEQGIEEVEKEQRQRTNGNSKSWKSMDGKILKKRSRKEVEEDEEDGGDSQDDGGGETKAVKMFRFPMDRIRRIIKSEDPGSQIMRDAVFLVNKATVRFRHHHHLSLLVTNFLRSI